MRQHRIKAALLIGSALLATAVVLVLIAPFLLRTGWRAIARETVTPADAEGRLGQIVGSQEELPKSLKVLKVVKDGGRDPCWYYKLRVPPEDVPAFKSAVSRAMNRADPSAVDDADGMPLKPGRTGAPGWWDPQGLSDADVVRCYGWFFAFSPSTGTVYVYEWES